MVNKAQINPSSDVMPCSSPLSLNRHCVGASWSGCSSFPLADPWPHRVFISNLDWHIFIIGAFCNMFLVLMQWMQAFA